MAKCWVWGQQVYRESSTFSKATESDTQRERLSFVCVHIYNLRKVSDGLTWEALSPQTPQYYMERQKDNYLKEKGVLLPEKEKQHGADNMTYVSGSE